MHYLFTDDQSEALLTGELRRSYPTDTHEEIGPRWVRTNAPLDMPLAFCRQALPNATEVAAASINAWASSLLDSTKDTLPQNQPWQMQIAACYGQAHEGLSRSQFIQKAFHERLHKKRRALLRTLQSDTLPLSPTTSLVQLYLTSPQTGYLSIGVGPLPHSLRRNVWPFSKGELPIAVDKAAPSRAFAKLVESEQRLGRRIGKGDLVVDLGACPGSWSYVAVNRGAQVISVDRSPLREDLMRHPHLTFIQGDAFKYTPPSAVDWLICDVIATADRSMALLLDWIKAGRCRRFVVSLKFKGSGDYSQIDELKAELPALCSDFYLARLCANKNEVCAFGVVA